MFLLVVLIENLIKLGEIMKMEMYIYVYILATLKFEFK